jgi:hypothetical protein
MKTLRSFETPGTTDPATEPYVPEDLNPASYRVSECLYSSKLGVLVGGLNPVL